MTLRTLTDGEVQTMVASLSRASRADRSGEPPPETGDHDAPIQVLYGGAHLFRADTPVKLAGLAVRAMEAWGSAENVRALLALPSEALARDVVARVSRKLAVFPIESSCIDFEDGYGPRPDDEEDGDATRAASALATVWRTPGAMRRPAIGVRVKSLGPETAARAIRTLDLFVTELARATDGRLPSDFTVTLPKVTRAEEVRSLADLLDVLEGALGLDRGSIGIELMIETPSALIDGAGRVPLSAFVAAGGGRCRAAHLGAYDLTASLGITATDQRLDHPVCDVARATMQLALAESAVAVVDGATTVLPIAPHRAKDGQPLVAAQEDENRARVLAAWKLHADNVRRALAVGIHRGWDLHPAQLPARYATVFAYYLTERDAMSARLRGFVERATQAMRSGQVFDDAATGQGLLNFFLRGLACGALDERDLAATGLTDAELRRRSFAEIVRARGPGDEVTR